MKKTLLILSVTLVTLFATAQSPKTKTSAKPAAISTATTVDTAIIVTKPATTVITPALTGKLTVQKRVIYTYAVKDSTGRTIETWNGNYTTGNTDSASLADFKKAKGWSKK